MRNKPIENVHVDNIEHEQNVQKKSQHNKVI